MANHNKTTRIRTLYTLKMLYTGCSTKEELKVQEEITFKDAFWVKSGKWK